MTKRKREEKQEVEDGKPKEQRQKEVPEAEAPKEEAREEEKECTDKKSQQQRQKEVPEAEAPKEEASDPAARAQEATEQGLGFEQRQLRAFLPGGDRPEPQGVPGAISPTAGSTPKEPNSEEKQWSDNALESMLDKEAIEEDKLSEAQGTSRSLGKTLSEAVSLAGSMMDGLSEASQNESGG